MLLHTHIHMLVKDVEHDLLSASVPTCLVHQHPAIITLDCGLCVMCHQSLLCLGMSLLMFPK